jgi:hypothetical protein
MAEPRGPLIAVLGAGGAVGGLVARALDGLKLGRLRLGARGPQALAPLVTELGGRAEAVVVDAAERESLARFCAGCQVLVNCAGSRAQVAEGVLATGTDYVDPGGNQAMLSQLAGLFAVWERTAVLGAGVLPGLSTLVPRWLASGLQPPLALTAYLATQDKMTRVSAAEFLISLAETEGTPHGMWRAGARLPGCLQPEQLTLPFFPGDVVAYPHLSAEAEALARRLRLDEVRWYFVFGDGRVLTTLSRLAGELRSGAPLDDLAAELVRVVDVEMLGRAPLQQMLFQLTGREAGRPASRVAVLRASGTYQLTATVTALTVAEVLHGRLPAGPHFAADVLRADVVDDLDGRPGLAGLHVLDGPLAAYEQVVQGTV